MTNISFVSKLERNATLIDAIESSRHRKLASSRSRIASRNDEIFEKWWKNFEIMTTYFVINKVLQTTHLKHFELSVFWVLNILSHFSFFFSFFLFSSVYRLSMTRYLLDLFIELIVTKLYFSLIIKTKFSEKINKIIIEEFLKKRRM